MEPVESRRTEKRVVATTLVHRDKGCPFPMRLCCVLCASWLPRPALQTKNQQGAPVFHGSAGATMNLLEGEPADFFTVKFQSLILAVPSHLLRFVVALVVGFPYLTHK